MRYRPSHTWANDYYLFLALVLLQHLVKCIYCCYENHGVSLNVFTAIVIIDKDNVISIYAYQRVSQMFVVVCQHIPKGLFPIFPRFKTSGVLWVKTI